MLRRLDEIDEGAQRRWNVASSRVIQVRAWKADPPILQYRLQLSGRDIRRQPLFKQVNHAMARHGGADRQVGRGGG